MVKIKLVNYKIVFFWGGKGETKIIYHKPKMGDMNELFRYKLPLPLDKKREEQSK